MSEYEHTGTWTDINGNEFEVEHKLDVLKGAFGVGTSSSNPNRPEGFERRQQALKEARES